MKATIVRNDFDETMGGTPRVSFQLDLNGASKWAYVYVTEKSLGMARAKLRAAGFDIDARDLYDLHVDPFLCADHEVDVEIKRETYQGREREKVEIVTPTGQPIAATKATDLTAMMRALGHDEPAPIDDDPDLIPF